MTLLFSVIIMYVLFTFFAVWLGSGIHSTDAANTIKRFSIAFIFLIMLLVEFSTVFLPIISGGAK